MNERMRHLMTEISARLDELESEYRKTAPVVMRLAGRKIGYMPVNCVSECRELYDWSIHVRERIGGLLNLKSLASRYGVSYQTVSRYVAHSLGMSPDRWKHASTAGAGRSRS